MKNNIITEFINGQSCRAYEALGAVKMENGIRFSTYAPHARKVELCLNGDISNSGIIGWKRLQLCSRCGYYLLTGSNFILMYAEVLCRRCQRSSKRLMSDRKE